MKPCVFILRLYFAMLFRESTAMLVKPAMGHSLQRHANVETPLVGSVRLLQPLVPGKTGTNRVPRIAAKQMVLLLRAPLQRGNKLQT